MAPRILLHTGPPGAGTSTVAAATVQSLRATGETAELLEAGALLGPSGEDPVEGLALLLEIRRRHDAGDAGVLVVDCGDLDRTHRLIALPGVARRRLAGRPADDAEVALYRDVVAAGAILRDHERAAVRIVLASHAPGGISQARRAAAALALAEVLVDAVVIAHPGAGLAATAAAMDPIPVLSAPAGGALARAPHAARAREIVIGDGVATLSLPLPFARGADVELSRSGRELEVVVDGVRATLDLPPLLDDYRPDGATLRDGALLVTFDRVPIPADA